MKPEAWSIMSMIPQWATITSLYQQLTICPVFNSEHGLISQAIKFLIVQLVARPNASQKKDVFKFPRLCEIIYGEFSWSCLYPVDCWLIIHVTFILCYNSCITFDFFPSFDIWQPQIGLCFNNYKFTIDYFLFIVNK